MMTGTSFYAAVASLLMAVASGHEQLAGPESRRSLNNPDGMGSEQTNFRGMASGPKPRLLQDQGDGMEGADAKGAADDGDGDEQEEEDRSIIDSISDAVFDDYCDRTEKEVSGLTDLSGWMSTLDDDTLLTDITIPGTHQSGTYELSTTVNPNDPEYRMIEEVSYNLPDALVAPWICRFSLAQSLSLSEQLQAGVRYFDLRVDLDSDSGTFRAFHVLFGPTLEDLLGQIVTFMKDRPTEIVLVEMSELFNPAITSADKVRLRQILLDSFGAALIPEWDELPTVGRLRELGKTVLVSVHDEEIVDGNDLLWGADAFRNTFANTPSLNDMIAYNAGLLDEFAESNKLLPLKKLSWTLTPDTSFIRDNVLSGGLYDLAKEANGALRRFASDHKGKKLGDVLLLDYVETSPLFDVLGLSDKSEGEFRPESAAPPSAGAFALTLTILITVGTLFLI